jgi:hypothetical protein
MLLIGSRALKLRRPDLLTREPLDFDFVCTRQEYDRWITTQSSKVNPTEIYPEMDGKKMIVKGSSICEFELIQPGTSSELLRDLVENDPESIETSLGWIPSLDMLFALKTSHRYLKNSPHFFKTFLDWHSMRSAGAQIRPEHVEFLKLREKETYAKQKHPSLMKSKDEFFSGDGVEYVFDHDSIHESQKFFDKPAYKYYAREGSEVFSDKAKFFAAPREIQIAGAIEEVSVLALERSIIPHKGVWTPKQAWLFSFSKVASSVTSGWFRQFVYENGIEIIRSYPENYVEKFEDAINSGIVKRVNHLTKE